MEPKFVRITFDLYCDWQGLPPVYRILLSGELFAEREWRWEDIYVTESLQILAPPGKYKFELHKTLPSDAKFCVKNHTVAQGPAEWVNQHAIQILDK